MSQDVYWHESVISRNDREERNGHKGCVMWFTGLSASGKSTTALALEAALFAQGCNVVVLDGDNVRHGLCADLSFSAEDRHENLRRIGEMAKLFSETGAIVLAAFISPYRSDRELARSKMPHGDFLEIYCNCSVETCAERDLKGLYKRAMAGEIENFTGISAPYEEPLRAEITIDTAANPLEANVDSLLNELKQRSLIS
ncbi:adenylyl-sulfate kinase [Solemya elarraichensis gill symbiont]|uniref:Adenylyl-sulfate kinase n=1 Tax=Solemya elarraichensis gill symbiont TaxID=1918949 RepID=A0A1T2LBA6_9GAMM|nr:adenylyl-sulfate kinase [Solemya elarraichensis gill symbiont]OOZ42395.1 adenylyl-sulfate kinase [Solemya elarraichensis gill symbiont]